MRTYRRIWLCWWGLLATLGLLLGLATVPTIGVVGVFLTSAVVAGAGAVVSLTWGDDDQPSTLELVGPAVRGGLHGAVVGVTVVVTSVSLGTLVLPLLVLLVGSSPWALRNGVRLARGTQPRETAEQRRTPAPAPARAPQESEWAPAIRALSDEELCRAWRASYLSLQEAPSAAYLELVTLREAYLDDLERRNPLGMRAWLDSGARAAGNPAPYLARPSAR